MVDQETLQAIGKMMDKKLDSQMQETKQLLDAQMQETKQLLAVQGETMDKKLDSQKSELEEQISHQLNLMIENYFDPRFNLLSEELQGVKEKLEVLDDLEVMDTRITALEAMVKKINREVKELKKAQ